MEPSILSGISWSFLILLTISPALCGIPDAPLVATNTGMVQGKRQLYKGCCMDAYYGIPYAKPPVGDLRFKTTVPLEKWDGILDATKKPPACPQGPLDGLARDSESVQSEDCLYLNIWTPCKKSSQKAVMVWIHGGNFIHGSASMSLYDGSELVTNGDVVLVNINYRLGVLGFASSNSDDAPGNAGMYDQAEALKWIHNNIGSFGGNSSSITLFGQSAGSVAISLHAVSPLTSELFHRAVMESGSTAVPVGADTPMANLNSTDGTAKAIGCSSSTSDIVTQPHVVMECMRNKDFQLLANISKIYEFVPQYGDSFMPKDPRLEIIKGKSKNCDRIVGVNADEGSAVWIRQFKKVYRQLGVKDQHPTLNKNRARLMMQETLSQFGIPPGVLKSIIEYYLNKVQGDGNEEVLRQAYTSAGDSLLLCPSVFEAEKVAQQGNKVYFFVFSHRQTYTKAAEWMGVFHSSEIPFVFGVPLRQGEHQSVMRFTQEEIDLSRTVVEMWTNFAKNGSPCERKSSWPLYSYQQPFYVKLNTTKYFDIGWGPHRNNCDVFRQIYGF